VLVSIVPRAAAGDGGEKGEDFVAVLGLRIRCDAEKEGDGVLGCLIDAALVVDVEEEIAEGFDALLLVGGEEGEDLIGDIGGGAVGVGVGAPREIADVEGVFGEEFAETVEHGGVW
jgi:hypothetical protein